MVIEFRCPNFLCNRQLGALETLAGKVIICPNCKKPATVPAGESGQLLAFLDIETTGLSPIYDEMTVIGICLEKAGATKIVQFVGAEITASALKHILVSVETAFTFNGEKFDLEFIKEKLNLSITDYCKHEDLMFECWKRDLYGGQKKVEAKLGIRRKLPDICGADAVCLWNDYLGGDKKALETELPPKKWTQRRVGINMLDTDSQTEVSYGREEAPAEAV